MSLTLSKKNSKFSSALSALLDPAVTSLIEFEKAVISDNGENWEIYFSSFRELNDDEEKTLYDAVRAIVPAQIQFENIVSVAENDDVAIPTAHRDDPLPERRFVPPKFEERKNINSAMTQPFAESDIPDYSDVPLPDAAPPENENDIPDSYKSIAEDSGETAMDRYRKRMNQLSKEASEKAKEQQKAEKIKPESTDKKNSLSKDGIALFGKDFTVENVVPIKDLNEFSGRVIIEGDIISKEVKPMRDGEHSLFLFAITDYTSTISGKFYKTNDVAEELNDAISGHVAIQASCKMDDYAGELVISPFNIVKIKQEKKTDTADVKRIEMHLHTKMSQMDGVTDANELVKLMMQYGHDTVAITDHGVVQAYTDMESAIGKYKADIKLILGMEGYLLDDDPVISGIDDDAELEKQKYCFYSVKTSGTSALTAKILEIGACIYEDGLLLEETFHSFINPHVQINSEILYEMNLDSAVLENAPDEKDVILQFAEYSKDCILVSHNAKGTMPFMRTAFRNCGFELTAPFIDTLRISREIIPNIKSGKFNKVCDALNIKAGEIDNCLKEAQITCAIMRKLFELLEQKKVYTAADLNKVISTENGDSYHIIMYAKNKQGLFNLYSLVTESHLHHLRRKRPQIPRSSLIKYREGLILASACEAGELYRAMLRGVSEEELEKIASFYDYLEVQPLGNNEFLVREGAVKDTEHLIELNKKIIALGDKLGKPVIATGDVHYLLPRDAIFRSIIQCAEGYPEANIQAPLYYRTTQEMLDEFYYLPEEKRKEIVIDNPRAIADQCEKMESFPRDHLYTPEMDNAEEELREMCERNAHELYGEVLPDIVAKRLEKELTAIIKHGYAVLYLIAHKVVKKSLSDGYLVGSRGSVGSSFAATMADITEVNPLAPHYVCPNCKYSDFDVDPKYDCGIDMPEADCPKCGTRMKRLGFNIPFEVFMGFDGDKVPDIDLNFSGVYQPVVHKYIEELFGEKYVFRAGTIGGVADKTAIGYTKKYCEEYKLGHLRMAEILRLSQGCVEVKRTTGQHAGGVVILPKKYNINEFTPLQYPANDPDCGIITTHFTFHSLHDTLLKADILGHDDPTVIRMLEDLTGINAKRDVPLNDPKVMSLFLSPEALGVTEEQIGSKTGTFGIPEFGTGFTRKMLEETQPKTFSDLVKISGLSHGTDVWTGNAQELIAQGIATISECICTREDIMNNLLKMGVANFTSFDTMEKVRKGKGIPEKYLDEIREHSVPEWFIESCNKIKYMFPKAHAAAYVMMALRIAWFKVYKPHQYYATYFTVRADDFEIGIAKKSISQIRADIKELHEKPSLNPREKGILVMLEMILEMKCRGIEFADIDIYESKAMDFTVTKDNLIRPPMNAVPGLGENAAKSIVEARENEMFKSQDDLLSRTKLSATLLQALQECGCLKDLPKSQQMSLFDF